MKHFSVLLSCSQDRILVSERMKEHVAAPDTVPLLIFPEGTCVNNEYTVLFKKGAFELGAAVCPIAIKCVECMEGVRVVRS